MIDTATIESYMRDANPIPHIDDVDPHEFAAFAAAATTRRAAIMQAPTQHETTPTSPTTPPPLDRRNALVFAAAFILILASIGIAALVLRGDNPPVSDEPAPPTTVAETPEKLISVDSLTWSRINLGTQGPGRAIAEGGPGLVAVGVYHEPDPSDLADGGGGPSWVQGYRDLPTVWTSSDGYEWSRVPDSEVALGGDVEIAGFAGREDLLVAVAENYAWTSPDGITWSQVPDGTFKYNVDRLSGVIAGGPGFVAFGDSEVSNRAAIWTSPDGYAWAKVPDDPAVFNGGIHAMTVGGPGLVAVGSGESCEPIIWTSPDGYSWTRLPHDPTVFGESSECGFYGGPIGIGDVSAGGPGLVAVGRDLLAEQAAVWTSPNGATWTRTPNDPAVLGASPDTWVEMSDVAAIGDGLVAIGIRNDAPAVWISHDGLTWTDITDDFDLTGDARMGQMIAGGPGVVILGADVIEDYDSMPPLIETVMWIGSPSKPTG